MPKVQTPAQVVAKAQARAKREALETAFGLQVRQYGLPEPERQCQLIMGRKWAWDFVWHDHGVSVEINGGTWNLGGHSSGVGIQRDADKANEANLLGYCNLIFTGDDVKSGKAIKALIKALKIHDPLPF